MKNLSLLVLAVALYWVTRYHWLVRLSMLLAVWLFTGGLRYCYLFYHTWRRDGRILYRGLFMAIELIKCKLYKKTLISIFRDNVTKYANDVMFVNSANDDEWTFQMVEDHSNRVANYFLNNGYKKGDVVAFFMENRPEYVATWLGLAKIGVIPALINFNLRNESLLGTIKVANCRAIIYGIELQNAISEIEPQLKEYDANFKFYHARSGSCCDDESAISGSVFLDNVIQYSSALPEPLDVSKSIKTEDTIYYIYTSGTTGLPKAVVITHMRAMYVSITPTKLLGMRPKEDVFYVCLPMYHTSGGQMGVGFAIAFGNKTVIKKKFSASSFWKDCVKYDVTVVQHIGELLRYLVGSPFVEEEKKHKVRKMFGNGLRAQIWEQFVQRFNVKDMIEIYGATEGNIGAINIENKVGAVGFVSRIMPEFMIQKLLPYYVLRVDKETGVAVRDLDTGFCQEADPGEEGELVGKIIRGDPVKEFKGYKDAAATKKKILEDVFEKGDKYFRSGDFLVRDEFGWLYFKDRFGDTFRWRGENVSTTEVEASVFKILGVNAVTSYGVTVPETEGRASMITIVTGPSSSSTGEQAVDLDQLYQGVMAKLPSYARPMFVRLAEKADLTGTFKLKKVTLQSEGFDVNKVSDPIFFLDVKAKKYVRLTSELHEEIMQGKRRL